MNIIVLHIPKSSGTEWPSFTKKKNRNEGENFSHSIGTVQTAQTPQTLASLIPSAVPDRKDRGTRLINQSALSPLLIDGK
jgi:hypothetical protein